MKYRNTKTGIVFYSDAVCKGEFVEEVKEETEKPKAKRKKAKEEE